MSICPVSLEDIAVRKKMGRNEPEYVAQFVLGKLLSARLLDRIDLKVYIRKMVHQHGICWSYDDEPSKYRIVINSELGRVETIRAIAHEAVHVMQYATGKMKDLWGQKKNMVLWENTTIIKNVESGAAYYNAPWEKEAYRMQGRLARSYLRHIKQNNILTFD